MKKIVKYAHAKINLSLDILYKREDGYHEIESIMQEISLKDRLIFENRDKGIVIESNNPHIPLDLHNLVYKVWEKMNLYTGLDRGLYVNIEKTIPVSAGLAGGSSNAGAAFKAINELWELNLRKEELMKLAKDIGADVPFCILGGTALARGIGEELTSLEAFRDVHILICNPGFEISTQYAYSKLDLQSKRIDTEKLVEYIKKADKLEVARHMENKMEKAIIKKYPIIGDIKEAMIKNGALGSLMSGSGPTVFGIFEDSEGVEFARKKLLQDYPLTYSCKSL